MRKLEVHEHNYLTHDSELVVVVFKLNIGRDYLCGVHCEILVDHRSLQLLMTQRELNCKKCRRIEFLKDYGISIMYHLSKANVVVDALSQKSISNGSLACISVS